MLESINWFNSFFPESLFSISPENYEQYKHLCISGKQGMQKEIVTIGCLARNIENKILLNFSKIEAIGKMFADYSVVVYTNDNDDKTLEYLNIWQKQNDKVKIIAENLGKKFHCQTTDMDRAVDMAAYRNILQREVLQFPSSFVIIADLDVSGYSYRGLANSFGWRKDTAWDSIGSNGLLYRNEKYIHYDAWAYREVGHELSHDFSEINEKTFRNGDSLHPVFSCFGGLAIYTRKAYQSANYSGIGVDGNPDCDHVALNRYMRECGYDKIFLNPSMITLI